ncbi:MAG: homoserine O-acetyltransferase MetX [Brevinematia bacterium]
MKADIGVVETKFVKFAEKESEYIKLSSGRRFGPITVAYETYGELNSEKTNAILICHALSGNAHAAGYHDSRKQKPGWWNDAVGPGKAIDTDKYFVICSNVLGGCAGTTGPSSINPQTGKPYGATFPVITISDMVRVQKLLIDYLGIKKLLCVIGGSMGGMQALEWALQYPESIASSVVIAATARLSPQSIAFNAVGRNAIIRDENWNNGDYYGKAIPSVGLSIARMIGHITYLSDESMHKKFGRRLQEKSELGFNFSKEFQVESYLDYQGNKFVEIFDANTYLYVTKAMDYFDVAASYGRGSLEEAMKRIKSRMLVLSFTSDWLFPPYQSQEMVYALLKQKKDVTYFNIESSYGHDAFLLEIELEEKIISSFIDATFEKVRNKK